MPNKKGFYVIPLLIIMIIVGIIAALVVPPFMRDIDKMAARGTMRGLAAAEREYYQTNHEYTVLLAKLPLPDDLRPLVGDHDLSIKMGSTFLSVDHDDTSFVVYANDPRFAMTMDSQDSVVSDKNF